MASLATGAGEDMGVLEDPISFEPFKAPTRILPCGHTLNHDSLVDLLSTATIDDVGNEYFACPVDRQRFSVKSADEFPRNFQLEQQIENILQRSSTGTGSSSFGGTGAPTFSGGATGVGSQSVAASVGGGSVTGIGSADITDGQTLLFGGGTGTGSSSFGGAGASTFGGGATGVGSQSVAASFGGGSVTGFGSAIEYVEADTFLGPRPGFVFKMGDQGLGYYTDIPI